MQTIKCFWAGRLIVIPDLENDLSIEVVLEEIEKRLREKKIKHASCGTEFIITELCIDVMEDTKLVAVYNLKA